MKCCYSRPSKTDFLMARYLITHENFQSYRLKIIKLNDPSMANNNYLSDVFKAINGMDSDTINGIAIKLDSKIDSKNKNDSGFLRVVGVPCTILGLVLKFNFHASTFLSVTSAIIPTIIYLLFCKKDERKQAFNDIKIFCLKLDKALIDEKLDRQGVECLKNFRKYLKIANQNIDPNYQVRVM